MLRVQAHAMPGRLRCRVLGVGCLTRIEPRAATAATQRSEFEQDSNTDSELWPLEVAPCRAQCSTQWRYPRGVAKGWVPGTKSAAFGLPTWQGIGKGCWRRGSQIDSSWELSDSGSRARKERVQPNAALFVCFGGANRRWWDPVSLGSSLLECGR